PPPQISAMTGTKPERLLRLATRECERRRPRVGAGSRRHERARQGLLPCKAARPLSPIGTNARKKIFCEHRRAPREARGLNTLANAVKITVGPRGRNVRARQGMRAPPTITKDGVTVAKQI